MTRAPFFLPTLDDLKAVGQDQVVLHEKARCARDQIFNGQVFIRAVVEISNYCRENCHYCGMRRDNRQLDRFRLNLPGLMESLLASLPDSVTDLDIQAGEDPKGVREIVLPLIQFLKQERPQLGITVCLGCLDFSLYDELKSAGASIYIMKFEVAPEAAYQRYEAPVTWEKRLTHIKRLAEQGWFVSSGFISGLPGHTESEYLENFKVALSLQLRGCSVSPFIPGESTPLANENMGDAELALNSMAALRLMRHEWIIPAVSALSIADERSGYVRGLNAGANLVTINLTPTQVRSDYLLYKRDRSIMTEERIFEALELANLNPSPISQVEFFKKQSPNQGI
jgi:biotin synthase